MSNFQRANLIQILEQELQNHLEDVPNEHQAFVRLAADWLGFDDLEEEKHFIDASNDRGIDFWYGSESGFEVFQVKSHKLSPTGKLNTKNFTMDGVQDLNRATNLLTDDKADTLGNEKLAAFRKEWEYAITTKRMADAPQEPFLVNLGLVIFGDGLTKGGKKEFDSFGKTIEKPISYRDIPVEFRAKIYDLDEIISARWREDNRDWRDKNGEKRNQVDLTPEILADSPKWVRSQNSVIFYCRAIDLIRAFGNFGYQIFEPNVRAHIKKSKVNTLIRKSLAHKASRREFKYLNNGVTIICKTYANPTENRESFSVTEPGIANGLQTVVALYESYTNDLSAKDKEDLEGNCYVLVRLLRSEAVRDINSVVLASNTQNPMQARNLRSNTTEQIYFERLFAHQLGWFYERKQGAWDAFKEDPKRWRSLPDKKPKDFEASEGGKGYRRVDNESLAQTWLSLLGFSNEAVHFKRYLFEEDDWYNLVFLHRTAMHGASYSYNDAQARENWTNEAPSPALMLASYLSRQFAKEVSLSGKENREQACAKLGIDAESIPREELGVQLAQDDDYLQEQVLAAMTYVFVDFLGFVTFKSFGEKIHGLGPEILRNGSLEILASTADFAAVRNKVRSEEIEPDDFISITWFAFRNTIEQLMAGPWKQSYQTARSRTRFNHSVDTRSRINKQVDSLDKFMKKSQLTQFWAAGIPPKTGLYDYIRGLFEHS